MADMCRKVYDRILPDSLEPDHVVCTYIVGHQARCSWETLRVVDEVELEEAHRQVARAITDDDVPEVVREVLRGLTTGKLDAVIELILAAGHDRKRARRRTVGFPRRTG